MRFFTPGQIRRVMRRSEYAERQYQRTIKRIQRQAERDARRRVSSRGRRGF